MKNTEEILELRKLYAQKNSKEEQSKIAKQIFLLINDVYQFRKIMNNNICREICIQEDDVYGVFENNGIIVKMGLDQKDMGAIPYTILIEGNYEKEEGEMVEKLTSYLESQFIMFDIGANLGWYGINEKKRFPECRIDFFEPVPNTYNKLKKNLQLNDICDCHVNNVCVGNKEGIIEFYYDTVASGASSMVNLRELTTTEVINVQMITLDEYAKKSNIKQLDFIKCDTEGSEFLVLQGGKECIEKYKPIIFSEMLRKWSAKFDYHPNDIIRFLKKIGYECYVIQGDKLKRIYEVSENTIQTNYFFLHQEKHRNIIQEICIQEKEQ